MARDYVEGSSKPSNFFPVRYNNKTWKKHFHLLEDSIFETVIIRYGV